jgi:transcriptional regulator with XRE-family HTH domain
MNYKLLIAIKEKGLTQREFAKLVGDHESIVSRIVNGQWNADEMRKIKYAKILGLKQTQIF